MVHCLDIAFFLVFFQNSGSDGSIFCIPCDRCFDLINFTANTTFALLPLISESKSREYSGSFLSPGATWAVDFGFYINNRIPAIAKAL